MNWKRSTRCDTGACVEVAFADDGRVHVADGHGGVIELRAEAWAEFAAAVRRGEFTVEGLAA